MRDASLQRLIIDAVRSELSPPARSPKASLERILARRAAGERILLPLPDAPEAGARERGGGSSLRRSLPWTVALIAGAAALAAALPGSALRRWIERRAESATPRAPVVAPVVAQASDTVATPPSDAAVSGVTVPIAEAGWVSIEPGSDSLRVRFRLTNGTELEVRGIGGAARAIFRPRAGGIGVTTFGGGEIQVDVPRGARAFELRVGGVTYLAKEGARLRVLAPDADTVGADLVFQAHGSRSAKP